MPQVHIILVHNDEQTIVGGVYQNLEDAQAELDNPAYDEDHWADGGIISTFDLK